MKILFFGRLKDITGVEEIEINGHENLESLKKFLIEKFPGLRREVFTIAINFEIAGDDIKLKQDDEIALLPPIAGG